MTGAGRLHASCVAIGHAGVLLMGEPGAGKSDLSVRLIDRGAKLVADDQVELLRKGAKVLASSPASIAGLIEVRGVGIFKMKAVRKVPVLLVLQLAKQEWIERLPYPEPYDCLGVPVSQLRICAFEPSAAIKVEMAVAALQDSSMTVGAFKE
jgi:serine kinase of HPr protein (carbohydrate metabolism regulator)